MPFRILHIETYFKLSCKPKVLVKGAMLKKDKGVRT